MASYLGILTDMETSEYTHPSNFTAQQRRENTAALHDRFARAFAKVGNDKDAAAARRLAKVARAKS